MTAPLPNNENCLGGFGERLALVAALDGARTLTVNRIRARRAAA